MHFVFANKLGALGRMIEDAMTAAIAPVSPSAAALLLTLQQEPAATTSELAAVAGVAQPTAVRLLDGLARQGWIERAPRHGRVTPLHLTAAGAQEARRIQSARLAALKRLLSPLAPEEAAAFETALDRLLAEATPSRAFARTTCRLCDHQRCVGPLCPIGQRAREIERQAQTRHAAQTRRKAHTQQKAPKRKGDR